ncbi:MAG TPA: VOC family protein [Chloroflexota bacterium]|nr:VOC family protein [Chloroflexota bacterium]
MAAPVKVVKVGHVGLKVSDLSRHGEFYTDTWGLGVTEEDHGALYLRAAEPVHHVVALYEGDRGRNAVDHVGLQVRDRDDLERAAEELTRRGIEVVMPPGPSPEPGAARAMRFRDPAGQVVELYTEPETVGDDYGERVVKPTKLSHVVLNVPDIDAAAELYTNVLGFRQIDWNGHWMCFLNCERDHHSLALAVGDTKLNHVAFEVHDWLEIAKGIYNLGEKGVPRIWGPGRHGPGHNVFSYFWDPDKNVIEYTCEVDQVDDSYVPRVWEPRHGDPDWWCAYPPPEAYTKS